MMKTWAVKEWVIAVLTTLTLAIGGLVYNTMADEIKGMKKDLTKHSEHTVADASRLSRIEATLDSVEDTGHSIRNQLDELKRMLIEDRLTNRNRSSSRSPR